MFSRWNVLRIFFIIFNIQTGGYTYFYEPDPGGILILPHQTPWNFLRIFFIIFNIQTGGTLNLPHQTPGTFSEFSLYLIYRPGVHLI
jgi:hypothetical protein